MRWIPIVTFICAAGLLLSGCGDTEPTAMPDDFAFVYEWREGSLPPPYHYEYSISVDAAGAGEIELIPDYPGDAVPVWRETFRITREQRESLFRLMVDQGLLRLQWNEDADPPVGGSYAWARIMVDGREVRLPSFAPANQQAAVEAIYAAIEALPPQAIRANLERMRADYVATHEER